MKVVFIKNVEKVGKIGQVAEVKNGYAKNYLLPKGLAVMEGDPRGKGLAKLLESENAQKEIEAKEVSGKIKEIEGTIFKIKAKANEKGSLFANIKSDEIIKLVYEKFSVKPIEVKNVPIKEKGKHTVDLDFGKNGKASVTVNVEI